MKDALKKVAFRGGSLTLGVYGISLIYRSVFPTPRAPRLTAEQGASWVPRSTEERVVVFDRIAPTYDHLVEHAEMGATNVHRRQLLSFAKGRVLEVGVGTGRNLALFGDGVASVVAIDASPSMLQQAKKKYEHLLHGTSGTLIGGSSEMNQMKAETPAAAAEPEEESYFPAPKSKPTLSAAPDFTTFTPNASPSSLPPPPRVAGAPPPVQFAQMDVHALSALPDGSFDTVVDTFGLCSYEDPLKALREMARLARLPPDAAKKKKHRDTGQIEQEEEQPTHDGDGSGLIVPQRMGRREGRVLLLEHGMSASTPWWVRQYREWTGLSHWRAWGCQNDLPIDELVAQSGLRVIQRWEFNKGTMVGYVLGAQAQKHAGKRKKKSRAERQAQLEADHGMRPH